MGVLFHSGGGEGEHKENWCISQTCTIAVLELGHMQFQLLQVASIKCWAACVFILVMERSGESKLAVTVWMG